MHLRVRSFAYMPMLALAMGLMLARMLIFARILDHSEFGTFSSALLISSTFCMLACLGLQLILQRDLPLMFAHRREHAAMVLVGQCAVVAVVCLLLLSGVTLFLDIGVAGLSPALTAVAVLHGFSQQLFLVATVESRSRGHSVRFALQNLARAILVLGAGATVGSIYGKVELILAVEVAVSIALAGYLIRSQNLKSLPLLQTVFLALRRLPKVRWNVAVVLLLVAVVGFFLINIDRWIAAQLLPQENFAIYAFAWTILMVAQSVQVIVNATVFPLMARQLGKDGMSRAFQIAIRGSVALLSIGLLAALPIIWIAHEAIERWFPSYSTAGELVAIFLVTAIFRVSDFWTGYLIVVRQQNSLLKINIGCGAVVLTIWAVFVTMPGYGINLQSIAVLGMFVAILNYLSVALRGWIFTRGNNKRI